MKHVLLTCMYLILGFGAYAQTETQNPSFPFWKVKGNSGTNSSVNFLGTTDNVSLRFRANNQNYMVLDSNGVLGIGVTKTNLSYGYAKFEVASEGISPADILLRNAVNDAGYAPGFIFQHARGTLSGPTAVANGDYLAAIQWQNYDGASYIANAGINVYAEGAVSVGTIPTRIDIYTNGGSVSLNRLGNVGIGIAAPLQKLHISGSTSGMRIGGLATGGSFITATSAATDKLLYADAAGDVKAVSNGTNGSVLTINGSGVPVWTAPGAATQWLLTGNTGTVDGVNYIGTTDNVPFTVKTNGQQSGRVDPLLSNSFWGYWAGLNTTGTQNTAVGTNALVANTSGMLNTAIGTGALQTTSASHFNTAVGGFALATANSASGNVAIGYQALTANTTGSYNTMVGTDAGHTNTNAAGLTAVGGEALYSNLSGLYLTAMGYQTLRANSSGNHNTGYGYSSLLNTTTGSYNVAVGAFSMFNNQTAMRNTGIGTSVMYFTRANDNTAAGYEALNQNQFGRGNVAFGSAALRNAAGGNYNIAIGDSAQYGNAGSINRVVAVGSYSLFNNSASGDHVALGDSAAFANSTGTKQIAIGSGALLGNTTGNEMIAIGYHALYSGSDGFYNIAIGNEALSKANSTEANIAIGRYSQRENNVGGYNTSLGVYSLGGFSTAGANTFSSNVAVGYTAGSRMRTGQNNVLVGTAAGGNMISSSNSIAIGAQALDQDGAGSFNVAVGGQAMSNNTSGNRNVAVGVYALTNNLSGSGNTIVGHNAGRGILSGWANTLIGDSATTIGNALTNATAIGAYSAVSASNCLVLGSINGVANATSDVKVGIGTTAPVRPLEIATGQLRFSSALGDLEFIEAADLHSNVTTAFPAATTPVFRVHSNSSMSNVLMYLQHDGNLGIGTTAPTNARFIVEGMVGNTVAMFKGASSSWGISMVTDWPGIYFNSYFNGTGRAMAGSGYPAVINADQSSGGLVFLTTNVANTVADATVSPFERMRITGSGFVGINQGGPAYYLEMGNNSAAKPGSNTWTIPSDRRLKKDIEPFKDGLETIDKINPVWFRYNGNGGVKDTSRFVGIIAQEVQPVAPYMVGSRPRTNTDGSQTEYLDYDGNAMTYILVNSVKELKEQNEELQKQVQLLTKRLDEIGGKR